MINFFFLLMFIATVLVLLFWGLWLVAFGYVAVVGAVWTWETA